MKLILVLFALVGISFAEETRAGTTCNCGWVNSGRIVGGIESVPNKYPWMVALLVNRRPVCGASIITPWHALTAAHCGVITSAVNMQIAVGHHNLNQREQSKVIQIAKVINHQGYSSADRNTNYDIALLVTATKIPLSNTVGPVCLPSSPINIDNQYIKVTGWGLTTDRGSPSDVLREVDLVVMPTNQCTRYFPGLGSQKLCAWGSAKDSCQGDSGGPLVWLDPSTNRYTQAALVSYGGRCGGPNPSVNTDVSTYIPWIKQQIQATKPEVAICTKA